MMAVATAASQQQRSYGAVNLQGWEVLLGDALKGSVGQNDIETLHADDRSELRANINRRPIMAHNITLNRINDDTALGYTQTAQYEFRLPFIPQPDVRTTQNAQTIEGMLVTWDGSGEQRDLGVGFQWYLNPWGGGGFGELRAWSTDGGADGRWQPVGHLAVDTLWHTARMQVDFPRRTGAIWIDGALISTAFTATTKLDTWGRETAARLTAEIVSCDPGSVGYAALHRAEFRNWSWTWQRR